MGFPTAADLAEHPGLVPWLETNRWQRGWDPAVLATGRAAKVREIHLEPDSEACDLLVRALVTLPGQTPTRDVWLFIDFPYDRTTRSLAVRMRSECSCPAGDGCSHVAGVLHALQQLTSAKPTIAPSSGVDPLIAAWLARLNEAAAAAKVRKQKAAQSKPSSKFIAYCIGRNPHPFGPSRDEPHFFIRLGSRLKNGFSFGRRNLSVNVGRPANHVTAEDIRLCARFDEMTRTSRCWGGTVPLDGPEWDEILTGALATGRLFHVAEVPDSPVGELRFAPLTEGPPADVHPKWETLPGGSLNPELDLGSDDRILIPIEPPRYLDVELLQIGPLRTYLPAAVLTAWRNGPVVSAAGVPQVSERLAAISPEHPLPLPSGKPPRMLGGLPPSPILFITNVLVGIYQKRHIGALVNFQYPGSPRLFPLNDGDPTTVSWFDGDQRTVLERDIAAEQQLLADLAAHGLTPLHQRVPADQLTEKNRHSVIVDHPTTRVSDWLEFLESPDCKTLKEAGWTIETDHRLNLRIHEILDLVPAIEPDSDHGIDWFRFDLTGEFEGKTISLIPQIARAIAEDWHLRFADAETLPETLLLPCENPQDGHIRFPARRFLEIVDQVRHLFHGNDAKERPRMDRLSAAGVADGLAIRSSETTRALAEIGRNLRDIHEVPAAEVPPAITAELRPYQADGFRWLQFLARHGLHGILADDMGLGKTLQTLAHLAAEAARNPGKPSLVVCPTSVVPNWAAETARFAPTLKTLVLHGSDRADQYDAIRHADLVITSYPLLVRDFDIIEPVEWQVVVLDEAQYIKNPKALASHCACHLKAAHRLCLSGTPMENHLGELWSLMRFLMPGFLADEKTFNIHFRKPIERDRSPAAQLALNRRVSPLILRRTKDQVATELPEKTLLIHGVELTPRQTDLYESVRAAMDVRVREAINEKGLAQSHIIVLDALLKLRQICCHPQLLQTEAAQRVTESAKLEYLTQELLPTLLEEGRRILLFSQFTSMLDLIEEHLQIETIPYLKLTGRTRERASLVKRFQEGEAPVFLISLKAGGTGLNLTAADTVIHYDPWWNPAAENQATDRAHRIGQVKPVFVHKLVCRGTIEDRILELQQHKAALVEALLSEETTRLRIDAETLSHLLSPVG